MKKVLFIVIACLIALFTITCGTRVIQVDKDVTWVSSREIYIYYGEKTLKILMLSFLQEDMVY